MLNRLIVAVWMTLALACPAMAQVQGGDLNGVVFDERGGALRGVTVTVGAGDATLTAQTNADGSVPFPEPGPGVLQTGADPRRLHLDCPGANRGPRRAQLRSDVPDAARAGQGNRHGHRVADGRRQSRPGTATNFTADELTNIPTSRDPFSLMRSVPGVLVDRVNVGGNETGQQSNFATAKGTRPQDAVWTLDGVAITDMAADRQSPTYFNYDNFDEIHVSTAGQRHHAADRRPGLDLRRQARHQPVSRRRARLLRQRCACEASNVPAELAARRGVTPEHRRSHRADLGLRRSISAARWYRTAPGSTARTRSQDVRLFRRDRRGRQHAAEEPDR